MKHLKPIRITALVLFLLSLFAAIDLGLNFLKATVPSLNDGIGCFSTLHGLFGIFGDSGWSLEVYLHAFEQSVWAGFFLFVINVFLFAMPNIMKKR